MDEKGAQPYKPLHKYRGMRPKDIAIWDEFLLRNPTAFVRVWYDTHIGDPSTLALGSEEMKRSGMYDVSCWCVVVIADDGNALYVIEIKPNALAGALGQALAYKKFVEKLPGVNKPVYAAVLTDNLSPITQEAASMLNVALFTP
jgi:hypothetical protein